MNLMANTGPREPLGQESHFMQVAYMTPCAMFETYGAFNQR